MGLDRLRSPAIYLSIYLTERTHLLTILLHADQELVEVFVESFQLQHDAGVLLLEIQRDVLLIRLLNKKSITKNDNI